jgi:hypothetical protein
LCFWILAMVSEYLDGDLNFGGWPKKIIAAVLLVLLGIFFYSDPLFAYMLLLPLIVFLAVLAYAENPKRRFINAIMFLIGAAAASVLIHHLFTHYGIMTHHTETKFIQYSDLWHNINQLIDDYFRIFSANFWGGNFLKAGTVLRLINSVFMVIAVLSPVILIKSSRLINRKNPWAIFLLVQPAFLSLVYVLSNNTTLNGVGAIRFLVLLPFYAIFILPIFFDYIKTPAIKPFIYALLILAIGLNSLYALKEIISVRHEHPNSSNFVYIDTLNSLGLTKGYANYWDSNINMYLSNNKVDLVPVNCMQIQHWLMDDHSLNVNAAKSFYIYNPARTGNCESPEVISQVLGTPKQVVSVGDSKIFVFNYDIKSKLRNAYYP